MALGAACTVVSLLAGSSTYADPADPDAALDPGDFSTDMLAQLVAVPPQPKPLSKKELHHTPLHRLLRYSVSLMGSRSSQPPFTQRVRR
jgi:hypothetical protein